jgi:tRNA threonylcarbamoyl adenosine modification protein YjeE
LPEIKSYNFNMTEIILRNLSKTRSWAAGFAKTLRAPCAVALHGDLGAGKSEVARAIIQTLCGQDTIVPSPTFTLAQSYEQPETGSPRISHFDLYRVTDVSELEEIGLTHALSNDITLIEWPEVAAGLLPSGTTHVYIEEYDGGRKISVGNQRPLRPL